jgi:hypothetical protein
MWNRLGVAVEEILDPEIKQGKLLDFALYDKGKAVSLFRRLENKRYETIFATRGNEVEINSYKGIYKDLVPECWLVNEKFAESHETVLPSSEAAEEVKSKARRRNENLNNTLRRRVAEEDSVFVLVVSEATEITDKVNQLCEMLKEYRTALGV